MTDSTDPAQRVADLVRAAHLCMLTTQTDDGRLVSRPMALQEAEFDGDLWFFTHEDSSVATQIGARPQVGVSFADHRNTAWTSIAGTAEVVRDRARMEELWSAPLKVWFPDGPDTPGLVLLRVAAHSAEYWDSPASRVKRLVGAARAAVTGDADKFPGTNESVDLDK